MSGQLHRCETPSIGQGVLPVRTLPWQCGVCGRVWSPDGWWWQETRGPTYAVEPTEAESDEVNDRPSEVQLLRDAVQAERESCLWAAKHASSSLASEIYIEIAARLLTRVLMRGNEEES